MCNMITFIGLKSMRYTRQYKSNNSTFIRLSSNVQMHEMYFYISYILCFMFVSYINNTNIHPTVYIKYAEHSNIY